MALGFNNAPVNFGTGGILTRAGESYGRSMGAGLAGLGQGIGKAIEDYRQKKEEKMREEEAAKWLVSQGIPQDEANAAVKAVGAKDIARYMEGVTRKQQIDQELAMRQQQIDLEKGQYELRRKAAEAEAAEMALQEQRNRDAWIGVSPYMGVRSPGAQGRALQVAIGAGADAETIKAVASMDNSARSAAIAEQKAPLEIDNLRKQTEPPVPFKPEAVPMGDNLFFFPLSPNSGQYMKINEKGDLTRFGDTEEKEGEFERMLRKAEQDGDITAQDAAKMRLDYLKRKMQGDPFLNALPLLFPNLGK